MTNPATRLLAKARDKISAPGAWTQKAYARAHPGGSAVNSSSPRAACWCSLGACGSVGYSFEVQAEAEARLNDWTKKHFGVLVERYNDHPKRTQTEVVAMFDAAIAAGPSPHQTALGPIEELQK